MNVLLILLVPAGALAGLWGTIRGHASWVRPAMRKAAGGALAASFVAMTVGCDLTARDTLSPEAPDTAEVGSPTTLQEVPTLTPTSIPEPAQPARPPGVPAGAQAGVVERIVDGDTLWVRIDQPGGALAAAATHQIRVLEIDSPETKHPQRGVECWGPEATAFATRTLPVGSTVYLVADKEDRDRYGRFLRYIWSERGAFYNEVAVREGFARAVLYQPNDAYIGLMRAAETEARAANRGIWGAPCNYGGTPASGQERAPISGPGPPRPAAPRRAPSPAPKPAAPTGGCDPNYREACVPPYPPDLDCGYIAEKDFQSVGSDPHGLDRDNDGIACES